MVVRKRVPKFRRLLGHRSVRDAIAIAGVCLVTYVAATSSALLPHDPVLRTGTRDLDAVALVAVMFGVLMLIYARRRMRDLRQEILKRRNADIKHAAHAARLSSAVDTMLQGLLLFDADGRLILCNQRYIQMYGVAVDIVKPGCTLLELSLIHI